jgi:hypothetical protein
MHGTYKIHKKFWSKILSGKDDSETLGVDGREILDGS